MPDPHDLDRELHHHAIALRGIARDLLRDPHLADDLTQQTLHQALAHRHLRSGPLGGWLYRSLVNFVRQWRRGERRRTTREAKLPSPEPHPAPPDTLARRETLEAVTNAVLQLDEPYQTAIFLRYFEDLPPRAIVRRTGTNLATVKSRLQRGLVLLRARLGRHGGRDRNDWRLALASNFGLPMVAGLTLTTGAWLLGTTTKILFAAGLLCVGGMIVYGLDQEPAPTEQPTATRGDTDPAGLIESPGRDQDPTNLREAAAATATVEAWLEHPYTLELEVLVVDDTGLPVEGQTLNLAPTRSASNRAPSTTGPDGKALITWRSRTTGAEVILVDPRGTLRRLALAHGHRTSITLLGQASAQGTLHMYFEARTTSAKVLGSIPILSRFFVNESPSPPSMHAGLHPHAVFDDPCACVAERPDSHEEGAQVEFRIRSISSGLTRLAITDTIAADGAVPQTTNAIAGLVFGEDGKPVAKVPVALLGSSPQALFRTATDEQGQFRFDKLAAGEFTVRAGGHAEGLATTPAVVTVGTTQVSLVLRTEACVRGRVQTSHGTPIEGAVVEWRASDGSWCDAETSAKDGTFTLANLPGAPGTVFVWSPDAQVPLPIAVAANVLCNTGELLFAHDPASACALTIEPLLPEGCENAPVEVRVWNLDTAIGTTMPAGESGPARLANLPAGWYQVEVRAPGAGYVDSGRHWLDGKGACDLGRVTLPNSGRVRFAVPANALPDGDQRAFEVSLLRADQDVRVAFSTFPLEQTTHLPAGTYVFAFRHKDGGTRFQRFTVRGGQETVVTVPE